ncbi:hypothetical protein CERZMDRAFT_84558 [Cercospora zeae-maydis SCOH1-5]|uniref:Uncharacterized protein n=1 Tax=Cercospora zeae-maydis SCOH1-5 TaxID=717836 RepID=A0A6A6FFG0_9PEZI|nr:hypothetical protein CERZMDRAFT_84558 [Cercospora zeae-maydis SCOH1-5]
MLAVQRPQDVCGFGGQALHSWSERVTQPKDRGSTLLYSVTAMTWNPSDGTARRVPKLAVRNRDSEHSASSADFRQHDHNNTAEQQSSYETLLHPALRPKPGFTPSTTSAVTTTPRSEKTQSEAEGTSTKVPTKRKSKGVLGFLALKEPSTSAFEEFAEQEKKKLALQKDPKVLRGVSSQKLPQHVPKVNSKWDGLPESARRSTTEKDRSARHSAMSIVSSRSGNSERDSMLSNAPSFPLLSPRRRRTNDKHCAFIATAAMRDEGGSARRERSAQPSTNAMQSVSREQRPSARNSEESGSFYSFSSHPETPPELESSVYSNLRGMPATPDSTPRTPSLESSIGAPAHSSKGHVPSNSWHGKSDDETVRKSDVRDLSYVLKHQERIPSCGPHARSKAAPILNPHGSLSSAKDVAPWEAYEPRRDSAQPPRHIPKSNSPSAGHKLSQRFGAKLGFK